MARIKHTPGPWVVEGRVDGRWDIIAQEGTLDVAQLMFGKGNEQEALEALADASLIAAAPMLLQALERLLEDAPDYWSEGATAEAQTAIALAYLADDVARGAEEDAVAEGEEVTS